jgi:hypothetical protein
MTITVLDKPVKQQLSKHWCLFYKHKHFSLNGQSLSTYTFLTIAFARKLPVKIKKILRNNIGLKFIVIACHVTD